MPEATDRRACLDAAALARLAGRHASAEDAAAEAPHLAACPRCRARLERERDTATFIAAVRSRLRGADARSPVRAPSAAATGSATDELRGYRLLEEISRGGQATVHRAVHEPTGRMVAVKVIRSRSTREQARMEREASLVARLRHPGIVMIHDCGRLPDGAFAIAMELVDGVPLDAWAARIDRGGTDAGEARRRRLALVAKVCDAVDHAHRRGVIHRDLKPGNVLVDGADEPRVLDFGVARDVEFQGGAVERAGASIPGRASARAITRTGEFAGTLAYAAPEQIAGEAQAIDTRSDVYSIGVMLHELVCGAMPYPVDGPLERVARAIAHDAPMVPRTDRGGRRIEPDLGTVLRHALAKDPERRYASAAALGADLRRLLAGGAIDARRDSTLYVLRKAAARHKGAVAAGIGVAALAVAAAIALSLAYRDTNVALAKADAESARLADTLRETKLREAIMLVAGDSVASGEELIWREVLAPSSPAAVGAPPGDPEFQAALWALRQLHAQSHCLGSVLVGDGAALTHLVVGDEAWVVDETGAVHQLELPDLRSRCVARNIAGWDGVGYPPLTFVDPVAGDAVVVDRGFATVRRFDLESGRLIQSLAVPDGCRIRTASQATDGSVLLVCGDRLGVVRRDAAGVSMLDGTVPISSFSPAVGNGALSACTADDGTLMVIELSTGALRASHRFEGWGRPAPSALAMLPDGRVLANKVGVIALDPLDGSTRTVQACRDRMQAIVASTDMRRVASCSISGIIRVNDMATPEAVRVMSGHRHRGTNMVALLAFTADGDRLLSAGSDGAVRLWRCDGDGWMRRTQAHALAVHTIAPGDADGALTSIGVDGTVVRTRSGTMERRDTIPGSGFVLYGAVSADGRMLASAATSPTPLFVVRDAETLVPMLPAEECGDTWAGPFAFSPDGRLLAAGAGRPLAATDQGVARLKIVDLPGGRVRTLSDDRVVSGTRAVAFSDDGETIAWGLTDGRIFVFPRDATELPPPMTIDVKVRSVAFSPDGQRLVSAHENGHLVLWDVATRTMLAEQAAHAHCAMAARFSPDGAIIASATFGGEIGIWCATRFRRLAMLRDDGTPIHTLAFSRDGRMLHLGADDGTILSIDLGFHDRAIAANLEYWITTLRRHGVAVTNAAPLREWSGGVAR